jgi:3-methylfumaryl-CoA hydratase
MTGRGDGDLSAWVGRSETRRDVILAGPSARLSATLDRDDPPLAPGDAVPPLAHWLHFLPDEPMAQIGPDGHPRRGGLLPPVHDLPRRMWAGSRLVFARPLCVGDEVERVSTVASAREKAGRSGRLVFVTVRHEIGLPGAAPAVVDEHDIVYRGPSGPGGGAERRRVAASAPWRREVVPDPVMLFRFSALTFNGHRIHYDHPYVTGVEGYPNLVMNGGLTTLLVYELARSHGSTPVKFMSSRNVRALFVSRSITLCGEPSADNKTAKLWAQDDTGALALTAEAEFV